MTVNRQEMQNEVDKKRLARLVEKAERRKSERVANFPTKKDLKKVVKSSPTNSEKYKQMVFINML